MNAVEELSGDAILRGSLSEQLTGIYDLERLMSRIVYGSANGRELRSLAAAAAKLPGLKGLLKDAQSTMLSGVYQDLDTLDDVLELIDRAIVEDPPFTIRRGRHHQTRLQRGAGRAQGRYERWEGDHRANRGQGARTHGDSETEGRL